MSAELLDDVHHLRDGVHHLDFGLGVVSDALLLGGDQGVDLAEIAEGLVDVSGLVQSEVSELDSVSFWEDEALLGDEVGVDGVELDVAPFKVLDVDFDLACLVGFEVGDEGGGLFEEGSHLLEVERLGRLRAVG